jgi:hypothetical protein
MLRTHIALFALIILVPAAGADEPKLLTRIAFGSGSVCQGAHIAFGRLR